MVIFLRLCESSLRHGILTKVNETTLKP